MNDKPPGTDWIVDAFQTPLGAYYRVDHHSVPDLQAAINETGVAFVTAQIHVGWHLPVDGLISLNPGAVTIGGHAFLLIGYDELGFWILNSWGDTWGRAGFANLSYADWETLVDFFKDFASKTGVSGAGAGIFDTLTDVWDARLEGLASVPRHPGMG